MPSRNTFPKRDTAAAARAAAAEVREARRADPYAFGRPELFVVAAGHRAFAWELRRFGGVILERGLERYSDMVAARADGERALAALCAEPDLPQFTKQRPRKGTPPLC